MTNQFSLENKTALITGGGTGLGKAIAACMIASGARVMIVGRQEHTLRQTTTELGDRADWLQHDVADLDRADPLARKVTARVGKPHIIVHNAGIHLKKTALDTRPDELQSMLNTHLVGAYALTRSFAPALIENRGSILFITSMAAIFGIPYVTAYSAAKSALLGLVRSLTTELSPQHVRVNAIAPGWIDSDMSRTALDNDPQRKEKILSRTPMGCLGTPEDVGWAAVYLSSPAAQFVTGQQLVIDGGASIGF